MQENTQLPEVDGAGQSVRAGFDGRSAAPGFIGHVSRSGESGGNIALIEDDHDRDLPINSIQLQLSDAENCSAS